MPNRKKHIEEALRLIKEEKLDIPIEAVSVIETLIDHPHRIPRKLWQRILEECNPHPLLQTKLTTGLHAKGIQAHDWQSPTGQKILYQIIKCLYGPQATKLAQLHYRLDNREKKNRLSNS